MDRTDQSISWMIAGGLRADPAEARNQAHLRALRQANPRPTVLDRARAFVRGVAPATEPQLDQVCCTA